MADKGGPVAAVTKEVVHWTSFWLAAGLNCLLEIMLFV